MFRSYGVLLAAGFLFLARQCFSLDPRNLPLNQLNATHSEDGGGQPWVLLVAGSNGWWNYRHQADICHAYQLLHAHGIPDDHIVVMMFDDIARNPENPTPGIVINHPLGMDVYRGVPHDYTNETVTPENFLNILQGNETAMKNIGSGKVIKSGPDDYVFVYFADHGAPGLIAFPEDELYATDLMDTIQSMHDAKKYKQLVLYVEACESGSMFKGLLPQDINVYAMTAANPHESSYACYYDDERTTYLGDLYSVKWMEDSDVEKLTKETIHHQFKVVKQETNTSHVKQYGDLSIAKESVSTFQGSKDVKPVRLPTVPLDVVASGDVPMAILHHRLAKTTTAEESDRIMNEMRELSKTQEAIKETMKQVASVLTEGDDGQVNSLLTDHLDLNDFSCYRHVVQQFDQHCFDLSQFEYALRHLYVLVNMCETLKSEEAIVASIQKVCQ